MTTPTEQSVRRALAIQMIIDQEWGLAGEREPAAGLVHRRRAHRPRRGGGARRVRPDRRARRRARRDGDRLPARPHPGRVDALRARASTTASLPIVGVNTFLAPHARRGAAGRSSWPAATEAEKQSQLDRLRRLPRPARAPRPRRRCARLQAGGDGRRQRLRRADGRRAVLLARADQPRRSSRSAASTAATSVSARPELPSTRSRRRGGSGRRTAGRTPPTGWRRSPRVMRAQQISGAGRRGAAPVRPDLRPLRAAHAAALQPPRLAAAGRRPASALQVHPASVTNAVDRLEAPGVRPPDPAPRPTGAPPSSSSPRPAGPWPRRRPTSSTPRCSLVRACPRTPSAAGRRPHPDAGGGGRLLGAPSASWAVREDRPPPPSGCPGRPGAR